MLTTVRGAGGVGDVGGVEGAAAFSGKTDALRFTWLTPRSSLGLYRKQRRAHQGGSAGRTASPD